MRGGKPSHAKQAERSSQQLSRNKKKRLLKYSRFTHEESALLRPYPAEWWTSLILGAFEAGLDLEQFLSHEERIKKAVGLQLSSLDPGITVDRTRKPGLDRIQNIMAALG